MNPMKANVSTEIILTRGVEEVIDRNHLAKALAAGKKLRVKLGIDPTSPDLHLGHTVVLRKLRQFQDAGHKAVLIIGDFTAQIGDPSGQSEERKPLTEREVKSNLKKYLAQAGKVINIKNAEVHHNSAWHRKDGLAAMLAMAKAVTFQQIIKRADFQKRIDAGNDISVLEMLYPLLQGYDSVKVRADVELGGTDQKFNLLMGRRVQRHFGMQEQDVVTVPLIEGTDGVRKMSKSYGNAIPLSATPQDMFGKIMAVPDTLVKKYFTLLTDGDAPRDAGPRDQKLALAETIVAQYHSTAAAKKARAEWIRVFSKKEKPEEMRELIIPKGKILPDVVSLYVLAAGGSKSNAWRQIQAGGVRLNDKTVTNVKEPLRNLSDGDVFQIGKRQFFRIKIK